MPSPSSVPDHAARPADPLAGRQVTLRYDAPADGVTNMATDLALLRLARETGVTVLRLYGWSAPTVSLGRNERVAPEALARLRVAGLPVVRRPTGGRALLHDDELTYAVALPLPRAIGWRTAYAAVNARLVAALRSLDLEVTSAPAAGAPAVRGRRALATCFAGADEGELLVGGRKLVGSAVWREGEGYLQHGSLLLHDGQARLAALLGDTSPDRAPAGASAGDGALAGDARADGPATIPADGGLDGLLRERGYTDPVDALRAAIVATFAAHSGGP